MTTDLVDFSAVPAVWTRRDLLDLESLSAEELTCLLDTAAAFKEATARDSNFALGWYNLAHALRAATPGMMVLLLWNVSAWISLLLVAPKLKPD